MSTFGLGRFFVNRLGFGAMRLAGPGVFGSRPIRTKRSQCSVLPSRLA